MTTSPRMSLKSVISREDTQITPAQLGYLNARAKTQGHSAVLKLFMELSKSEGLTRAFLARRLGKKPEQITRWLGAPGNWTLDTMSNLLAAMGYEPVFGVKALASHKLGNNHHPIAGIQIDSNKPVHQKNIVVTPLRIDLPHSMAAQHTKYNYIKLNSLEIQPKK